MEKMSQNKTTQKKMIDGFTRYNQDWSHLTEQLSKTPQDSLYPCSDFDQIEIPDNQSSLKNPTSTGQSPGNSSRPNESLPISPRNTNEFQIMQQIENLKSRIQDTETKLFQFKGPYLGWTKEDHGEFLTILSRFEIYLHANLQTISDVQIARVEYLSKFLPSRTPTRLAAHYKKFVSKTNLENRKRSLLREYQQAKKRINLLGYARIQKENRETENLINKKEEQRKKPKLRSRDERLQIKRDIRKWKETKRIEERRSQKSKPDQLIRDQSNLSIRSDQPHCLQTNFISNKLWNPF